MPITERITDLRIAVTGRLLGKEAIRKEMLERLPAREFAKLYPDLRVNEFLRKAAAEFDPLGTSRAGRGDYSPREVGEAAITIARGWIKEIGKNSPEIAERLTQELAAATQAK